MNVLKAISLKVMSALLFAVMSALVRFLGETYPVGQIVFFRSVFAILPVLVVRLNNQSFAVPLSMVRAIIPPKEKEVQRISGRATRSRRRARTSRRWR